MSVKIETLTDIGTKRDVMAHLERALFVVGASHSGKSIQLRSMFLDKRLGTGGHMLMPISRGGTSNKIPEVHQIAKGRMLRIKLSSFHEDNGTTDMASVFRWIRDHLVNDPRMNGKGINFASALWPCKEYKKDKSGAVTKNLPGIVEFVSRLQKNKATAFDRVRICLLNPDRDGNTYGTKWCCPNSAQKSLFDVYDGLWNVDGVEVMTIDARTLRRNGLLLTDFFDFT